MNAELRALVIQNRINRLSARGRDNQRIIRKLERELKKIGGECV